MRLYPFFGAFESTKIHGAGQDILGTTRHIERWRDDLEMLRNAGILDLRYSIPWHRIETSPGEWDWSWIDGPMAFMEQNGMRPVLDPLHHTSFPDWLEGGFAHPEFPERYSRFVSLLAERYPWVERYTVFNEPLPTILFCSYTGMWHPHGQSDREFVEMVRNGGRAIALASSEIKKRVPSACFFHIDTCEHHRAVDRQSEEWAEFANHRRFLMHDLILGQIGRSHPLSEYLTEHAFTEDDFRWFQDNPSPIDVLGLDYYFHSEIEWCWDRERHEAGIRFPCRQPRGFASVAQDYIDRFQKPVMLGETNIRGTITDRITWLKFMQDQCEQLVRSGVDFRGFCWYPSIDSTDWNSCCTTCAYSVDPQGIWYLDDQRWERYASELSEYYRQLANGEATSEDLPAYLFMPPLDEDLRGFQALMRHWPSWKTPDGYSEVA